MRGANPDNTPFISTTDPNFARPDAKLYGSSEVSINARSMQAAIERGDPDVANIRIVPHGEVVKALETKVGDAQRRFNANPSPANTRSLERANSDLDNARRDGEVLVHVTGQTGIPSRFLSNPRATQPNSSSRPTPRAPVLPTATGAAAGVVITPEALPTPPPEEKKDK